MLMMKMTCLLAYERGHARLPSDSPGRRYLRLLLLHVGFLSLATIVYSKKADLYADKLGV